MAITKISNSSLKNLNKYDSFLAGNAAYDPSATFLIQRQTVGAGGAASITFSSIPSTYKHLQIRATAASGSAANSRITFNGDTANTSYSYHYLEGNGSATAAGAGAYVNYMVGPVTTNTASAFSGIVIDILDYGNTNKYKTIRTLYGVDLNGSSTWMGLQSGMWQNTSAISSINFLLSGTLFNQYSTFAIYGIKG